MRAIVGALAVKKAFLRPFGFVLGFDRPGPVLVTHTSMTLEQGRQIMDATTQRFVMASMPKKQLLCSLCFHRYPKDEAQLCIKCEVCSCPECAEIDRETGQVKCFACH